MARRKLSGLRVLVTGASRGIGRAIAVEAAKRGCRVLAAARSGELLDQLAGDVRTTGGVIEVVVADVTKPEDRQALVDAAVRHFGGLDVLVNNAGIGAIGPFTASEPDTLRRVFETNLFGLTETIRACLPLLRQGTTPAIVNVSSILGRRAWPGQAVYSASKFAVAGFSESLRAEVMKDGIGVIVVNPGVTRTDFPEHLVELNAPMRPSHAAGMPGEEVATATVNAIERDQTEVTLTRKGKLLVLLTRYFPWLVERLARKHATG